jgi:hypothetical protein
LRSGLVHRDLPFAAIPAHWLQPEGVPSKQGLAPHPQGMRPVKSDARLANSAKACILPKWE